MQLAATLSTINWLAVIVMTVFSFILGNLWHSPLMFGRAWKEEVQLKISDPKQMNMPLIFGTAAVCNIIMIIGLALFIGRHAPVLEGLLKGLFVGALWMSTALGVTYVFAQRTLRLFLIDAGYFIVLFAVTGVVLAAW